MLISFTGAQSTGKSTLLNQMVCDEYFRKCSFVKEVTRKVASRGLNINTHGNDTTQLFILSEHLYNHHVEDKCMVLDRCIIDGYIYTKWLYEQGSISEWVYKYCCQLHTLLINRLDVVFYTHPDDVPLEDDGVRSVDVQFRNDIINSYNEYIETRNIKPEFVVLRGDVNTRLRSIKDTLKNL